MTQPPNRQFQVVQDEDEGAVEKAASAAIMLALSALSQRTLQALSSLFSLLTCASVFWVWLSVPNPTLTQLGSLATYAIFVLTLNWLVRRK